MRNISNLLRQQSISLITLTRPSISPISIGQTSGLIVHALYKS